MQTIFESISRLNDTIDRVATALEQQSQVAEDISYSTQAVSERSQNILDSINHTDQETQKSSRECDEAMKEIASYKLA